MKKMNIAKNAAVLSIISLAVYGLTAANAATLTSTANNSSSATVTSSAKLNRLHSRSRPALTDAQKAERDAKMTAIKTALNSGDYTAWVAAVKAENANSPILTIITEDKFSQYVQAIKLREQAETIMSGLGIKGPHELNR